MESEPMDQNRRKGRRIPLTGAQLSLRAEGARVQQQALLSGVNRSRRRPVDSRDLRRASYSTRCPLPITPSRDLPGRGVLLSPEMIEAVAGGLPLPPPDSGFVAMVRGQYRRARYALRDKDFSDVLNFALAIYHRACHDYDPGRRYSRGPVGFVGGRVVNKLRSYFSPDRRKAQYAVESIEEASFGEEGNEARRARVLDAVSDHGTGAAQIDEEILLSEVRKLAGDAIRAARRNVSGRRGLPSMLPDADDVFGLALSEDSAAIGVLAAIVADDDFEDYQNEDHNQWSA